MDNQTVIYEVREQIGWVTLNRMEVMNAINQEMSAELREIVRGAENNNDVRVLVFTGGEKRPFRVGWILKKELVAEPRPCSREDV